MSGMKGAIRHQPVRCARGAPSLRGGDSPQGFPLEASEARSAAGAKA